MRNLYLGAASRRRTITYISNGSLLDFDCSDLTGWTDGDAINGVSDQISFDDKSTFRFDTNVAASGNEATRYKDVGSVSGLGGRFVVSINLYLDAIGTIGNINQFVFQVQRNDMSLIAHFASDGLFINYGPSYNEVETNLVVEDTWQEWTFDVDLSGGAANAMCDVYLDQILQAASVDCSETGGYTDGLIIMRLNGYTDADRIGYVDWIKLGNNFLRG